VREWPRPRDLAQNNVRQTRAEAELKQRRVEAAPGQVESSSNADE
jgi:hypothetical protein